MSEEFIRQSQMLDRIVLDRATMDEWGRIEVMWCYPKVHRVLGFICKSGSFDRTKKAFNLDQLDKIGENGVLVNSEPVETDRDRVRQLESFLGCEVWTDEGKKVGRINDYVFQLGSGNIRYYLLASSGLQGLTGKLYSLYPSQILGYGRGRVMVSAGIVPGLELYQVGLDQKLEQKFTGIEERLERKLKRVTERLNEGLTEEGLPVGQELKAGVQSLFERARSVTAEVSERVKDRAQELLEDGLVDRRGEDQSRDRTRPQSNWNDEFDFEDWDEPQSRPARPTSSEKPLHDRSSDRYPDRYPDRSSDSSTSPSFSQSSSQSSRFSQPSREPSRPIAQEPINQEPIAQEPLNQEPIAQRYSKRSANFEVDSNFEVDLGANRESRLKDETVPRIEVDPVDCWSDPPTPRPPLNLSTPKPVSSPTKPAAAFTAKPRPSTQAEGADTQDPAKNDPWDDDWV